MYGDHPKFRAPLQTISVKPMRACNFWHPEPALNSKFRRSKTADAGGGLYI
jgi:hypothetical protein